MVPKDWEKYKNEILPRVEKLKNNNQYLEMVSFLSCILEKEITEMLSLYEISSKLLLVKSGIKFSPNKVIDKEKLTLGKLKDYLTVYCDDKELITQIEKFNTIRIKTIHKIFDHDIVSLEREIINYEPEFYRLLLKILDLKIELTDKLPR